MPGYRLRVWWVCVALLVGVQATARDDGVVEVVLAAEDAGANEREVRLLRPELERFVAYGGDIDHVAHVIARGLERECWGTCLFVLVRGMVDTMDAGVQAGRAGQLVIGVLDQQIAQREARAERWSSGQLAAHLKRSLWRFVEAQRQRQRAYLSRDPR